MAYRSGFLDLNVDTSFVVPYLKDRTGFMTDPFSVRFRLRKWGHRKTSSVFLVSQAIFYISGQALIVDGGIPL
jgi:hypothetical protein